MAPKAKKTAPGKPVYIITSTEFQHHTDHKGRMKIACKNSFTSLREANAEAASILSKLVTRYSGEGAHGTDPTSDTIPYRGESRFCMERNMDSRVVEVVAMPLINSDPEDPSVSKPKDNQSSSKSSGKRSEDTDDSDIEVLKVVKKTRV